MLDVERFILKGSPVDDFTSISEYLSAQKHLGAADAIGQIGKTKILRYGVFELFYRNGQLVGCFAYRRHVKAANQPILGLPYQEIIGLISSKDLQYSINQGLKELGTIEIVLANDVTINIETDTDLVYNIGRNW